MTDTMTSQNVDISFWDILYNQDLSGQPVNAIFWVARKLSRSEKVSDLQV
jgi:hypothetical protein